MTTYESQINTSDYKRGDVSVRLSYPTGAAGKRVATLLVTDKPSGQTLVEVDLSAADLMELMGNGAPILSGARLPHRPELIGKRSQNISASITRASGGDLDELAEDQRQAYLAEGWESVRIDRTNSGRQVVAYRWIDDDE